MKTIYIYTVYFLLFIITACSKKDNTTAKTADIPPLSGIVLQPKIGGSTLPNQVYIDLSTAEETPVQRTSWDLGFYFDPKSADFRVILNNSINKMAAKELDTTDIDQVQVEDKKVATSNREDSNSKNYGDDPSGDIQKTVIRAVSGFDQDNKVYLLNLGQEIATNPAEPLKVNMEGASRGWKKIRILRNGDDYKLQYADLNATTHKEVIIRRNAAFNFSFFSFNTNSIVPVEPEKDKWDLNLTTFTNVVSMGPNDMSYFFSDCALINARAGVTAYQALTAKVGSYEAFRLANVDRSKFETVAAKDQRAIGSNWRGVRSLPPSVNDDRFFVLKDATGNIYKIKFLSMYTVEKERGNITFQYELLK